MLKRFDPSDQIRLNPLRQSIPLVYAASRSPHVPTNTHATNRVACGDIPSIPSPRRPLSPPPSLALPAPGPYVFSCAAAGSTSAIFRCSCISLFIDRFRYAPASPVASRSGLGFRVYSFLLLFSDAPAFPVASRHISKMHVHVLTSFPVLSRRIPHAPEMSGCVYTCIPSVCIPRISLSCMHIKARACKHEPTRERNTLALAPCILPFRLKRCRTRGPAWAGDLHSKTSQALRCNGFTL